MSTVTMLSAVRFRVFVSTVMHDCEQEFVSDERYRNSSNETAYLFDENKPCA